MNSLVYVQINGRSFNIRLPGDSSISDLKTIMREQENVAVNRFISMDDNVVGDDKIINSIYNYDREDGVLHLIADTTGNMAGGYRRKSKRHKSKRRKSKRRKSKRRTSKRRKSRRRKSS